VSVCIYMPALLAAAVWAAAFSPAAVLFATVVARRPVLVVLVFLSAFAWLLSISLAAALAAALRAAVPAAGTSVAVVAAAAALCQEGSRYGMYSAYVLFLRSLRQLGVAVDTGPPAAHLLSAAVANGVGIWAAYTLVLYGDVLWRSSLPGSLYSDQCEGLSTFAVDAMSACGIGLVNVLLSCIGWVAAYPRRSPALAAAIVGLHLAATAATALNASPRGLAKDGCSASLAALGGAALLSAAVAAFSTRDGGAAAARDLGLCSGVVRFKEKDEPLLSSQSRAHRSSAPLDEPPPEETTRQRLNRPSAAASGD